MAKKCSFVGSRIQLIKTDDQYTNLTPGSFGIIDHIDSTGTIFVKWEDGSSLGLIPGIDDFRIVNI